MLILWEHFKTKMKKIGQLWRMLHCVKIDKFKKMTLRALSTLRGLRGAPEVPPLCMFNMFNRVQVLQKKVVRAVYSLPYNGHTHLYFNSNYIIKLQDFYNLYTCSYVYSYMESRDSRETGARSLPSTSGIFNSKSIRPIVIL